MKRIKKKEKQIKINKKKSIREQGITLVALIITIIILLILAGITLSTIIRSKWIISKSKNSSG